MPCWHVERAVYVDLKVLNTDLVCPSCLGLQHGVLRSLWAMSYLQARMKDRLVERELREGRWIAEERRGYGYKPN